MVSGRQEEGGGAPQEKREHLAEMCVSYSFSSMVDGPSTVALDIGPLQADGGTSYIPDATE